VNAAATGGDGSTWATAWKDVTAIAWSSIKPGATICIAGGTYGALAIGASGTADARICLKRAITGDAQCGGNGFQGGYDAQVVLSGLSCNTPGNGNYVTVDGRVKYGGIKIDDKSTDESYAIDLNASGASYMRLYNLDAAGPSTLTTNFTGDGRTLSANFNGVAHGLHVAYSAFHGKPTLILTAGQHDMVFEHNKLFDNVVGNPASWHPNVWVSVSGDSNVAWRFNDVTNWMVEGIMMCPNGPGCDPDSDWYIYGNVWHDATPNGSARVLEAQYVQAGPVHLFNNTFANLNYVMGTHGNGGSFASGEATNNLLYQTTADWASWNIGVTTTNLTASASPFVSSTDYHLAASSAPINAGTPIAPAAGLTFDHDGDGKTRGADGHWDIGAFEHE
jgi:hypothetical protein